MSDVNLPTLDFTHNHHGFSWKMRFYQDPPPSFLTDVDLREGQEIWFCSDLKIMYPASFSFHHPALNIFLLDFMIASLEEVYFQTSSKTIQGILFRLPLIQEHLLSPIKGLFSYEKKCSDSQEIYLYLPTDRHAYDHFVELTQDLIPALKHLLWLEQRFYPSLKTYWQHQVIHG